MISSEMGNYPRGYILPSTSLKNISVVRYDNLRIEWIPFTGPERWGAIDGDLNDLVLRVIVTKDESCFG